MTARRPLPTILRSTSNNPYFNLSLEHHLLQHPPDPSAPNLLLYTNTPTLVIGRNQSPFTELNLPFLSSLPRSSCPKLVRRRSGGGTVFHDLGNLNYCAFRSPENFDRAWAANLVSEAVRGLGKNVGVNERFDIYDEWGRKVSGSAYKIVRKRGYAHGTLLLNAELGKVGEMLRNVTGDWLKGRGVGSVRSAVGNIGLEEEVVVRGIVERWRREYGGEVGGIGEVEGLQLEGVREGMEELKSLEWGVGQTPRFEFRVPIGEGEFSLMVEVARGKTEKVWAVGKGEEEEGVTSEMKALAESMGERLREEYFDGAVLGKALREVGLEKEAEWVKGIIGSDLRELFGYEEQ